MLAKRIVQEVKSINKKSLSPVANSKQLAAEIAKLKNVKAEIKPNIQNNAWIGGLRPESHKDWNFDSNPGSPIKQKKLKDQK